MDDYSVAETIKDAGESVSDAIDSAAKKIDAIID
jgi:hypothetical protein